jgi:hypothetical protein
MVLLGPHTTRGQLSVLRKTLPINRQESGPQDRIIPLTVRSVSNNNIYSLKLPFYVFRKTAVITTADNAVSKAGEIMVTIEIAVSKDTWEWLTMLKLEIQAAKQTEISQDDIVKLGLACLERHKQETEKTWTL